MIIYTHPIADNLPIKTLVARWLQTNTHTHVHTQNQFIYCYMHLRVVQVIESATAQGVQIPMARRWEGCSSHVARSLPCQSSSCVHDSEQLKILKSLSRLHIVTHSRYNYKRLGWIQLWLSVKCHLLWFGEQRGWYTHTISIRSRIQIK